MVNKKDYNFSLIHLDFCSPSIPARVTADRYGGSSELGICVYMFHFIPMGLGICLANKILFNLASIWYILANL